ncbi:hypothetical protein NOK12_11770 [Nocardioides sp. OK12]|uniref:DUF6318 family protein n=1 Tax=Nocardioides sp. OK12 TaxID=2758661 RepID=UPI0021C2A5F2|nr:DUF6318 family protein [Nocardioides sp. OK12]GHJ58659.1 hypothetical protein NOK12_11770 [Nocardioides sp. OK12]
MRRHLAYAAAGAVVLALTSCGDDPEPQVADPTSTPSSSSSPSESAAAEKEPWEEKTPEGAIAFSERWVSEFSTAFTTGDTDALRAASQASCDTCDSFINLIDDVYKNGGTIEGNPWKLQDPAWSAPDGAAGTVAVTGTMRVPAQTITRTGVPPSTAPPTEQPYIFELKWTQDAWRVSRLLRDSQ